MFASWRARIERVRRGLGIGVGPEFVDGQAYRPKTIRYRWVVRFGNYRKLIKHLASGDPLAMTRLNLYVRWRFRRWFGIPERPTPTPYCHPQFRAWGRYKREQKRSKRYIPKTSPYSNSRVYRATRKREEAWRRWPAWVPWSE